MKHKVYSPNKPFLATSPRGTINATYHQLRHAFSEPELGEPGYAHFWKVDIDGNLCTIYDGPESLATGNTETWNVGGVASNTMQLVVEAFTERLPEPIQVIHERYVEEDMASLDVDASIIPED